MKIVPTTDNIIKYISDNDVGFIDFTEYDTINEFITSENWDDHNNFRIYSSSEMEELLKDDYKYNEYFYNYFDNINDLPEYRVLLDGKLNWSGYTPILIFNTNDTIGKSFNDAVNELVELLDYEYILPEEIIEITDKNIINFLLDNNYAKIVDDED